MTHNHFCLTELLTKRRKKQDQSTHEKGLHCVLLVGFLDRPTQNSFLAHLSASSPVASEIKLDWMPRVINNLKDYAFIII